MKKKYDLPKVPKKMTLKDLMNGDVVTTHSKINAIPEIKDWLVLEVGGKKFGVELNREGLDKNGKWAQLKPQHFDFLEVHRTLKPNRSAFRPMNLLNFRDRMTMIWKVAKPKAAPKAAKIKVGGVEYTEKELQAFIDTHATVKEAVCCNP